MTSETILYCTFQSAGRLFGVPVLDVKEVTNQTAYTKIPHAPSEILGLVNIRGHIFLALDTAALIGVKGHVRRSDAQLVVFKPTVGPAFGIVVDQVGDIVAVSAKQTEVYSDGERVDFDYDDRSGLVAHVCKLEGELLIVLDPRKFLPRIEQSIKTKLQP